MKKITITLVLLLCVTIGNAQQLPDYDSYSLKSEADFELAEPAALEASNFMLTTPIYERQEDKMKSMQFLMKWMDGTPHYKFVIDETFDLLAEDDNAFMGVYLAAQVKFMVENKIMASDIDLVKIGMWEHIADYIDNPAHKVTLSPNMAQMSDANKNGTLEEFLSRLKE